MSIKRPLAFFGFRHLCTVFGEYSNVCISSLSLSSVLLENKQFGVAEPTHGTPPTSFSYSDSLRHSAHTFIRAHAGFSSCLSQEHSDLCGMGLLQLWKILIKLYITAEMRHVKTNRSTLDGFLHVFSSLVLSRGQRAQLLHVYCISYKNVTCNGS